MEEHYQLEDESWKFDRWPEFFLGKNVADFYDPDIEERLNKLEAEEEKLLRMEADENALMDDEPNTDGVTQADLKRALKEVRSKKAILKLNHKMKKNLRARSKNKKLEEMEAHLEQKGLQVNKESLRQRVKKRKSIGELEGNQDRLAKKALGSDEEEDGMDIDEGERVGRKRRRSYSDDEDLEMHDDSREKSSKRTRSMSPAQLKISAKSRLRSMSKGRREGSVPQPHPTRVVPEEQIRLAKKINKRFKHDIHVNEADRQVIIKKPKHLYTGKRSNGKADRR